ncbi:MAG TPA: hypothetical protein VE783_09340 [Candidatus Limnocylindrales bacterium]|nr:hypothetical protein [Candidatus Limnocylindrales bacterium]
MNSQEESDLLLRATVGVAETQFQHGRFLPFAVTLGQERKANTLFTDDLEPDASRDQIVEYWRSELRNVIARQQMRAACHCTVARVRVAEGSTTPVMVIHLEHIEGGANDFVYPLRKEPDGKITLGEPRSISTQREIFGTSGY